MEQKNLKEIQDQLDEKKWNDGIAAGNDPCGSYDYCGNCDKTVAYPCATAKTANETVVEKAPCACAEEKKPVEKKPATDKAVRTRKPRAKKA